MSKEKSIVFGAGIPTKPDVNALMEKITNLEPGKIVGRNEIEQIIGCAHTEYRYQTVVSAWKKRLYRELNILIIAVPGIGFEVATNSDRVHFSGAKYKSGLRHITRAADVAWTTNTFGLTPEESRARTHILNAGATLKLAAATAAKTIKELC